MKTKLIIDADSMVYEAAFAAEHEVNWSDDIITVMSDITVAQTIITGKLLSLKSRFRPSEIVLALTDSQNWRLRYYPDYKATRKKARKPVGFSVIKDWISTQYNCIQKPGLEADDVCGWLSTKPDSYRKIVVSIDKDLRTIPGLLFNPNKDESPIKISKEEADYNHMFQTLVGDRTDNYKGCPGIGNVKARDILDNAGSNLWKAVVKAYEHNGLTRDDAFANAAAARIIRYQELDMKTLKLLWRPD